MKINCLKRLLFPLLLAAGTAAKALPDGVAVNEDGTFRIGEAKFQIQAWLSGWRSRINSNWSNRKVERQEGDFHLDGTFTVNNVAGTVRETLRSAGTEQFRLDCAFEFPTPVQLMALHATMSIPGTLREFSADGKKVRLPEEYREQCVFNRSIRTLSISLAGGRLLTISGSPLRVVIQDNRKFGAPHLLHPVPVYARAGKADEKFALPPLPPSTGRLAGGGYPRSCKPQLLRRPPGQHQPRLDRSGQ